MKYRAPSCRKQIQVSVDINNKYYRELNLSISSGAATSQPSMKLECVIQLVDDGMFRSKPERHRRRKAG